MSKMTMLLFFYSIPLILQAAPRPKMVEVNFKQYFLDLPSSSVKHAYQVNLQGKSIGKVWTQVLPQPYKNCLSPKEGEDSFDGLCKANFQVLPQSQELLVNLQGTQGQLITNSEASEACKAIGGVLPQAEDYQELVAFYQASPAKNFTSEEKAYFALHAFPDLDFADYSSYATSTCYSGYGSSGKLHPCESHITASLLGASPLAFELRSKDSYVRCISPLSP
ncbi:MAG: hypothetical protein ACOYL6_19390 [Bacteriovoracaceae bacterium]